MSDIERVADWPQHAVAPSCAGEVCRMCGAPATHKVGEEMGPAAFHNLTAYVCCPDFRKIMGTDWTVSGVPEFMER